MSKMRIVGIVTGSVLAAGLLTGGAAGAVWLFTPPTHPTVSVSQSHEITTAKQEDTQLAAATSRDASQWTIQREAAAKKAAAEAAAAALAAQQAADAQAAADAAAQAQPTQDAQTATASTDSITASDPSPVSDGLPPGSPVPWIANPDPQDTAGGRWDTGACASGSASGNPAICD